MSSHSLSIKRILSAAAILIASSALNAFTPAHAELNLRVGYTEFPPFEYTDIDGKAAGSFIDVTRKTLQEAGYTATYVALPISRIYLYLETGEIDLWPGLKGVPTLQPFVHESSSVPMMISLSAWYLDNTPPIHSPQELNHESVIVISGYTYGGLIKYLEDPKNNVQLLFTPNHKSGLQMLEKRRGEYLLDYNEPINLVLADYPITNLKHSVLKHRFGSFILSQKTHNSKKIIEAIDNAYMRLLKNNSIQGPVLPVSITE